MENDFLDLVLITVFISYELFSLYGQREEQKMATLKKLFISHV